MTDEELILMLYGESEPNDSKSLATPMIDLGGIYKIGSLLSQSDQDWFSFVVAEDNSVMTFDFDILSSVFSLSYLDVSIFGVGADPALHFKQRLAVNSTREVGLGDAGTYFFKVESSDPPDFLPAAFYTGLYGLEIKSFSDNTASAGNTIIYEDESSQTLISLTATDQVVSGQLSSTEDTDSFTFKPLSSGVASLDIGAPQGNYQFSVSLKDESGNVIESEVTADDTVMTASVDRGVSYVIEVGSNTESISNSDGRAPDRFYTVSISDASDPIFSQLSESGEDLRGENDLSDQVASELSNGLYELTLIANVFGSVLILDGITELVTDESHILDWEGQLFTYEDIDAVTTTVIRDGEFTYEFAAEIAESFPDSAGISYSTAVALIGQANMESTLMMVAGADGNYVG